MGAAFYHIALYQTITTKITQLWRSFLPQLTLQKCRSKEQKCHPFRVLSCRSLRCYNPFTPLGLKSNSRAEPHRGDIFVAAGEKNDPSSMGAALTKPSNSKPIRKQNMLPIAIFSYHKYTLTRLFKAVQTQKVQ